MHSPEFLTKLAVIVPMEKSTGMVKMLPTLSQFHAKYTV